MFFYHKKKGKWTREKIPKNNNKVPKTERLRKKKFWLKCGDCGVWFKRYTKTHGTRMDGKKICHSCLVARFKSVRPDLF